MAYVITGAESYFKREKLFLKQHPDMQVRYEKALSLLQENPFHPGLRLHALQGKYKGYHSVSISMQYRMTIDLLIQDREVILINIGSHDEVYG